MWLMRMAGVLLTCGEAGKGAFSSWARMAIRARKLVAG